MARQTILQQGKAEHYDFALRLFLLTMRPYMQELNVWDEQEQRSNFASQWKPEEVKIISVDGNNVGWLQVAELPTEIRLQKFFILPQYQRASIGSEVLSKLLATWRPTGKKIVLRVLKNNPARQLYETPWLLCDRRERRSIQNESVAASLHPKGLRMDRGRRHVRTDHFMLTTATANSASISSLVTSCTDVVGRSRHFSIFPANDRPALKNSGS